MIDEFINGLHQSTTVLKRLMIDDKPAVLTYNKIYGQKWLWVQKKDRIEPINPFDYGVNNDG